MWWDLGCWGRCRLALIPTPQSLRSKEVSALSLPAPTPLCSGRGGPQSTEAPALVSVPREALTPPAHSPPDADLARPEQSTVTEYKQWT